MIINGTDIRLSPYYAKVYEREEIVSATPVVDVADNEVGTGFSISGNTFYRGEQENIPISLHGSNRQTVVNRLNALNYLLRQGITYEVQLDQNPGVVRYAKFLGMTRGTWHGNSMLEFAIRLAYGDPFKYSETETEFEDTIDADPFDFQIDAEDIAQASSNIEPVITIALSAASAIPLVVRNLTHGTAFSYYVSVASGDSIIIDSRKNQVRIDPSSGDEYVAMSGASGNFPIILPRVNNSFRIEGVSAGDLTVAYRETFR